MGKAKCRAEGGSAFAKAMADRRLKAGKGKFKAQGSKLKGGRWDGRRSILRSSATAEDGRLKGYAAPRRTEGGIKTNLSPASLEARGTQR